MRILVKIKVSWKLKKEILPELHRLCKMQWKSDSRIKSDVEYTYIGWKSFLNGGVI